MEKLTWAKLLEAKKPLLLPVAHDALTARLIEHVGFDAYQVGGFALSAIMHSVPDIGLEQFGEKKQEIEKIIKGSNLPVMVDADDGYGDVKNVTRTIKEYVKLGVKALFIEDQKPPKKCGHMTGQEVIPVEQMQVKIKAAVDAKGGDDLFFVARTDAISAEGVDKAIERGKRYIEAGADGVYVEGAETKEDIEKIAKAFNGLPLAMSILEGGGKTPWIDPKELGEMGYSMLLYPTTILFQQARNVEKSLINLKKGNEMSHKAFNLDNFEKLLNIDYWKSIEENYKA